MTFCSAHWGPLHGYRSCLNAPWCGPWMSTPSRRVWCPQNVSTGRARRLLICVLDPFGSYFVMQGRQLGKTALLRHAERQFQQAAKNEAIFLDLKASGIGPGRELWPVLVDEIQAPPHRKHVTLAHGTDKLLRDPRTKNAGAAPPRRPPGPAGLFRGNALQKPTGTHPVGFRRDITETSGETAWRSKPFTPARSSIAGAIRQSRSKFSGRAARRAEPPSPAAPGTGARRGRRVCATGSEPEAAHLGKGVLHAVSNVEEVLPSCRPRCANRPSSTPSLVRTGRHAPNKANLAPQRSTRRFPRCGPCRRQFG